MNEEYDDLDELPAPPRQDIPAADLELLTLAALAIGAQVEIVDGENWVNLHFADGTTIFNWNSLVHGDDALGLVVKLRMCVQVTDTEAVVRFGIRGIAERPKLSTDMFVATYRAITRAAAEVGKQRS